MKKSKKQPGKDNSKINLDNEIIIGLTPQKEEKKQKKTKKIKNKKIKKNINRNKKPKKKKTLKYLLVKWTILLILLLVVVMLFIYSSVFNIKEIKVINNSKVTEAEVINLSTLQIGRNMFKYSNSNVNKLVKANPYIENVKVKRNIKGIVTLDITERKPTYMLKFANAFVYINNQGYMLEITEIPLELPMITGFKTPIEEIKEGNRLNVDDLEKLEDVIKIMNTAEELGFKAKINSINIEDKTNYKLDIKEENKIVEFGDAKNINIKLIKVQEILQIEQGIAGEIYFQDSTKTVFKENV